MLRFLLSFVVFLGFMFATILSVGSPIFPYLNLSGFLIIVIIPLLFISILCGFKEMILAFSIPFGKVNDKTNLLKTIDFLKMYEKIIWIVGIVSVVIILISTLISLDNPSYIGPMFQLSIIILLYSAIINVAIILPLILTVKKQI